MRVLIGIVLVIIATPTVAKTHRIKVRINHNQTSTHDTMFKHCHFTKGETDPDPRIRFQLGRDCRDWEFDE